MDVVEVGARRSKKHLYGVATRFVEQGLPKSLAVAMFSKGARIAGAVCLVLFYLYCRFQLSDNVCSKCGLNHLLRNSFTLRQHFVKG